MIPVRVSGDLTWYLEMLKNDGVCCESWRVWSGMLHRAGVFWEERKNWNEWKQLFLSDSEIRKFCWKPRTWERYEKKMVQTLDDVDLFRRMTWKDWHQRAHAAYYVEGCKTKWADWGKTLRECGICQFLFDVPEEVDSDPEDIALTEKLLLARYRDIYRIKEYIDRLQTGDPARYRELERLGETMRREYETFSAKEINVEIQRRLGVWTCPYCNSHYMEPRIDHKTGRIHAGMQMDHFYPKEKYGMLSMSLYNLVPSCSYCNHEKGSTELNVSVYREDVRASDTVFRYELSQPDDADFLTNKDLSLFLQVNEREGMSLATARDVLTDKCDVLHLAKRVGGEQDRVRYYHGLAVVEELIDLARDNTFDQAPFIRDLGLTDARTVQEWYLQVFAGSHLRNEADLLKRPYSKLRSDILDQLLGSDILSGGTAI